MSKYNQIFSFDKGGGGWRKKEGFYIYCIQFKKLKKTEKVSDKVKEMSLCHKL